MPNKKDTLTDEKIGQLIRKGKNFWVSTAEERISALRAAKFMGVEIFTKKHKTTGGFNIHFLKTFTK